MRHVLYCLLMCLPFFVYSQHDKLTCEALKNGTFYSYPRNSDENALHIRQGNLVKEVVLGTKDTVTWKLKWKDDCTYSLQYTSGNVGSAEVLQMLKDHSLDFRVDAVTDDYYTFTSFFDNVKKGVSLSSDTMWMKEKQVVASRVFMSQVKDPVKQKRSHFSDTSRYALLYVYRPGKVIGFAAAYGIYVDDYLMCTLANKSGFIYKILKEGKYSIGAKLPNSVPTMVDIKFGKSYYLKSTFGSPLLSAFKRVDMELVTEDIGKREMLDVNISTLSGY